MQRLPQPNQESPTQQLAQGDEDMKLAQWARQQQDDGQAEILQYCRHKRSGDLQTARENGARLARMILEDPLEPLDASSKGDWALVRQLTRMMFLYVAETAAKAYSPDTVLSQMVIASLNDQLADEDPAFYDQLEDCRAYTVYKLCGTQRDRQRIPQAMGDALSQMAGGRGPELARWGARCYQQMTDRCAELFARYPYHASRS